MRDLGSIKKLLMGLSLGIVVLAGAVVSASAQNVTREARQLQAAQRQAAIAYQRYQRTRRPAHYRNWQMAQARVQREQIQYQRAIALANNRGIYNAGYAGYNVAPRMYRIDRGGRYYNVDQRQVELLRSAVNQGYSQGYRQGEIDRQYRRGYNYGTHSLYRSGAYGYQSYVARDQYQYYFQQGFQRGYEDGFNSTYRYGVRSNNGFNILGGVLNTILRIVD